MKVPEPTIYVVPADVLDRPELRPLVDELGVKPGQRITVHGPKDWDITRSPRQVSAKSEMALRFIRPAGYAAEGTG